MYKLYLILLLSVYLFAQNTTYIPTTTILNYDVNMTITPSGELDITETLEVQPRNLHNGMLFDNPLLSLKIPTKLQSKNAIRGINREIGDFSVTLNDKPVFWEKKSFYKNAPNELIRLRLKTDYITSLLSDAELEEITKHPKEYIYTLKYTVKRSVIESSENGFDALGWKMFHNESHIAIKNAKINLFFPENLTKEKLHTFDLRYTSYNNKEQTYQWKSNHHFYAKINNFRTNDLHFHISFPQNILTQSPETNFNLVLDAESHKLNSKSGYQWDRFLLYWQFPFFIVYFSLLYYYARSYGSLGAMGSIVVRYNPPDSMTLLQSGLLLDKSADIEDFPAAIIELATLGHLKIIHKEYNKPVYLKRIPKDTGELSYDQRYLLNKVLFAKQDVYHFPSKRAELYQKLHKLNDKLYTWLERHHYIYEDFESTRKRFLLKAFLSSLPILVFSLYVTRDLYGENIMIGSIAGMFFLTAIIVLVLMPRNFLTALPFLIVLYIIIGVPFVMMTHSYWGLLSTPMLIMPFIYAVMWFFYKKIGIYTGKGLEAYRHLLGYEEFVKRTEVPKLEALLEVYPEHLERSLSYAMLFKMITYTRLPSFKSHFPNNHRFNNEHRKVFYMGKVKVTSNVSGTFFLFWLFGIILFFIVKAYKM